MTEIAQMYPNCGEIRVVRLVKYSDDKETMVFRDLERGEIFTSHSTHTYWNEKRMELIESVCSTKRTFFLIKFGYANDRSSQIDVIAFAKYTGFTTI